MKVILRFILGFFFVIGSTQFDEANARGIDDRTANSTPKYVNGKSRSEKRAERAAKNEARIQAARKAAKKIKNSSSRAAKAAAKKLGKRNAYTGLLVPETAHAPTKDD